MIISFPVSLKSLFIEGRAYLWPKPKRCPRCKSCKVWGHGYCTGLFDGFNQPLFLKRFRCPDCRCIMRCRPSGYFNRFQASIRSIRASIVGKATNKGWLKRISRSRQAHWWRALLQRISAFYGFYPQLKVIKGFDHFRALGQVPVSRAI